MFLNIITPCSRPQNLKVISESIPKDCRWIVVFDGTELQDVPDTELQDLPDNCEAYYLKDVNSIYGNAQRNFALNLVTEGHIYFNDDDTIIHPDLWNEVKDKDADFISFKQSNKDGSLRLEGIEILPNFIDSHNFIVSAKCVNTRWVLDRYDADAYFAMDCYKNAKQSLYIPKVLSVYNSLK
jgi:hypothetical protein